MKRRDSVSVLTFLICCVLLGNVIGGWMNAAAVVTIPPPAPIERTEVQVYEDGSGVQYVAGQAIRSFPADTFAWDCRHMGNGRCGSES